MPDTDKTHSTTFSACLNLRDSRSTSTGAFQGRGGASRVTRSLPACQGAQVRREGLLWNWDAAAERGPGLRPHPGWPVLSLLGLLEQDGRKLNRKHLSRRVKTVISAVSVCGGDRIWGSVAARRREHGKHRGLP